MLKLKALFQRGSHSNLYLFIYLPLQPLGRQALAQGRAEKIFQIHNLVFGAQGGGLCLLTNIDDGEHRWRREHAIFSGRVNKHFNLSGFFPNGSTSACLYVYRYAYTYIPLVSVWSVGKLYDAISAPASVLCSLRQSLTRSGFSPPRSTIVLMNDN